MLNYLAIFSDWTWIEFSAHGDTDARAFAALCLKPIVTLQRIS